MDDVIQIVVVRSDYFTWNTNEVTRKLGLIRWALQKFDVLDSLFFVLLENLVLFNRAELIFPDLVVLLLLHVQDGSDKDHR